MAEEKKIVNQETIGECNLELLRSQLFSDVVFIVGPAKDRFLCHQLILMARSPVFRSHFSPNWQCGSGWKKFKSEEIHLPDTQPSSFRHFLEFIYGDVLSANLMEAVKILPLAQKYQVAPLIYRCQQILAHNEMPISSVIGVYEIARQCNLKAVEQKTGDFMAKEFSMLVHEPSFASISESSLLQLLTRDDLMIDEVQLFNALIRWSDAHSKLLVMDECPDQKRKHILQKIIPLIRFPLMDLHHFLQTVVPKNLLTPQETEALITYLTADANSRKCMVKSLGFSSKSRHSTNSVGNDSTCWVEPKRVAPQCQNHDVPPLIGWSF